jgi:hypothetical protein
MPHIISTHPLGAGSGFKGMPPATDDTNTQEYENLSGSERVFVMLVLGIGLCGFMAGLLGVLRFFAL